jgi:hypothetical protein
LIVPPVADPDLWRAPPIPSGKKYFLVVGASTVLRVGLLFLLALGLGHFRTAKSAGSRENQKDHSFAAHQIDVEVDPFPIRYKRLNATTEEELRQQLERVRELALDTVEGTSRRLIVDVKWAAHQRAKKPDPGQPLPDFIIRVIRSRPDLDGLPVQLRNACRLERQQAENFQVLARQIRQDVSRTSFVTRSPGDNRDIRIDPARLRFAIENRRIDFRWQGVDGLPALQQILMGETWGARLFLVECLFKMQNKQGTVALARRALFELDPAIREAVLWGLKERRPADYREVLLEGLRYPWGPVAIHAAEALVALERRETVPELKRLLEAEDPHTPFPRIIDDKQVLFVREVVRINHLRNCLLCHAPSFSRQDPVVGVIPSPERPVPSALEQLYYDRNNGSGLVRADVTYLRQDFSVGQPVADSGYWPKVQRYDYLVRERPLTAEELARHEKSRTKELKAKTLSQHKQAVLFALRELTGQDQDRSAAQWEKLLARLHLAGAPGEAR